MESKKRIVFVDDEPMVLDGIRRMLRSMRNEWEMSFVGSGQEVLDIMSKEPVDVIVSDLRMPGMTGGELLTEVRKRYPATVRIALSGEAGKDSIFKSVGPIHQYLSKPCDAERLKSTVVRAFTLRGMLRNEKLKQATSEMESLPSMPKHYNQLLQELGSPDASIKKVESIISQDMGMSAKLLQLVNSAFFGVGRSISDPARAVMMVGLDAVRNLVLLTHVFSQFKGIDIEGFSLDDLWRHSILTASSAKKIAVSGSADKDVAEEAFIAGLLHDVGKLLLAAKLPDEYGHVLKLARTNGNDMLEAESEILGATHAEIGAYLLGLWGLSDNIVNAVAFHHHPMSGVVDGFSPLATVHVANGLIHEIDDADDSNKYELLNDSYLAEIGAMDRLPEWREICIEIMKQEEEQE